MTEALLIIAYTYAFYLLFIVTMASMQAWPSLSLLPRILLAPVALLAVFMDVCFNVASSLIFIDHPQEYMFTKRLVRYKAEPSWRTPIAVWLCRNLLDPFSAGGHCK